MVTGGTFDACVCVIDDEEMLHQLWNGLFPMLPYEGRVNPRWRDIGFQVRWLCNWE